MIAIIDSLARHARDRPEQPAVVSLRSGGNLETITYAQLLEAIEQHSKTLRESLPRAAIVPILASKSTACVIAMTSLLASGAAFSVLNRSLKSPQLNRIVADTCALFGIADEDGRRILNANAGEPFTQIPWSSIDRLPKTANHFSEPANSPALATDDATVACCLFTSGSTGTPKGVLIARDDLSRRAQAEVELFALTPKDVLLGVLPLSFDVGLNQLLAGLMAGCTVILTESWLPADMVRATATYGVTGISGVPAIWNDLLRSGVRFNTSADHRSLRYVTVSGGSLSEGRLSALQSAIGTAGIYKTYGQSETFRSTALPPEHLNEHSGSVGRPFGGAKVYVVRADGTPASPDEVGEVVHTGLGTMVGYLQGDSPNRRANPFRGAGDPNEWAVFTGDAGHLDANGFLFIHGRQDGMLKISGNRVYPEEVLNQLLTIEDVAEADVIGQPTETGDVRLVAVVTPESIDVSAVKRKLMTLVPAYMVPRTIVAMAHLPRTANGKIDRPLLKSMFNADGQLSEIGSTYALRFPDTPHLSVRPSRGRHLGRQR